MGEIEKRNTFLHNLKVSPHEIFTNYKGGKGNFTAEKAGRPYVSDQSHHHCKRTNQHLSHPVRRNEGNSSLP